MKGLKKCSGVLLLLFTIFGLSLNVCFDTNALKHEYRSIPLSSISVPRFSQYFELDSSTGNYVIKSSIDDFDSNIETTTYPFSLYFYGDAYYEDLQSISYKIPMSSIPLGYDGQHCIYYNPPQGGVNSLIGGFQFTDSVGFDGSSLVYYPDFYDLSDYYTDSMGVSVASPICQRYSPFGTSPTPSFDENSLGFYINSLQTDITTGVPSAYFAPQLRQYFDDHMKPYWFTADGFYTRSSAIDSDSGIHYNHSFSFSDMFTQPIKKFSELRIPLYSYDDYWIDGNNFTAGRVFEFSGAFDFDESVSFHSDIETNGSSLEVVLQACDVRNVNCEDTFTFPCTLNLVSVPGANDFRQLEYSCVGSLPYQTPYLFPSLRFQGSHPGESNDTYIFETSGDWRFAGVFVTTDNDSTPGQDFGSVVHGSDIPGDANNDMPTDDNADWFSSLVNLFNFGLLNPFAPLFELFSDQSVCASIPTLSSMLHSEEIQVCPFFSASTRAIVTPVLGISSMMLIFGFAVRWLGSSSGNFIEDSAGESLVPPNNSGTWGRRKTK